jgi:hypothetical protein
MPASFNDNNGDPVSQPSGQPQGSFANGNDQPGNDQSPPVQPSDDKSLDVDVSVLQKRVNDSQEFISTLKTERATDRAELERLQEELARRPSMEEIMEHINKQAGTNQTTLDPDDLINKAVEATEARSAAKAQEAQRASNINAVAETLKSAFQGEDLDAKVKEIAAENDMSFDDVFDLASRNPKAALKVLGVSAPAKPTPNGHSGSINTRALDLQNGVRQDQAPQGHIMSHNNDRDRISYFKQRMDAGLKSINQQ